MAQIEIQEKKRTLWPWVLAVLVLLLLAWWLFARPAATDDAVVTGAGSGVVAEPLPDAAGQGASAVTAFVAHVETTADGTMGIDHVYTAEGIRRLAAALDQLGAATSNTALGAELQRLREQADAIEREPQSLTHANMVRDAFTTAAGAMETVQRERFPALAGDVTALRGAATSIQRNRPLLEQREAVHTFFDRAASAVRAMAGTTA